MNSRSFKIFGFEFIIKDKELIDPKLFTIKAVKKNGKQCKIFKMKISAFETT